MKRAEKKQGLAPFTKILRQLMEEKGITVRRAASAAGVSPSTIDDWRAGVSPHDYAAVKRLAKELGVSFSFLLTGEEDSRSMQLPSVAEVFDDGGALFDGFAKITIQRLIPRKK